MSVAPQTYNICHSCANSVGRALLPIANLDGQECLSYSLVVADGSAKVFD